jgi:hypothetical protein
MVSPQEGPLATDRILMADRRFRGQSGHARHCGFSQQ